MLTFYVDRAVGKLPKARFDVPEKAKDELRRRAGDRDDDACISRVCAERSQRAEIDALRSTVRGVASPRGSEKRVPRRPCAVSKWRWA